MPEGVHGYPRWQGELSSGSALPVVVTEEVRRALRDFWVQIALVLVFAYALMTGGSLASVANRGTQVHTLDTFLQFYDLVRWGALAVAAIMAGPAFLEDRRQGALELYLARGVTRTEYMLGKTLSVLGLTTLAMLGPAFIYFVLTFLLFPEHPEGWAFAPLGIAAYGAMLAVLVTGLGLALSLLLKSARGATLVLLGGFVIADVFISNLLEAITRAGEAQILSPLSALGAQQEWLFGIDAPFAFPWWWGFLVWLGLVISGWGVVYWRRPRMAGDDPGRA